MKHRYKIDDLEFEVALDSDQYQAGPIENLSDRFGDLTKNQSWFSEGFTKEKASLFFDNKKLRAATEAAVKRIVSNLDPALDLNDFELEKYHRFVPQELHHDVVKQTRRLFPSDLDIDVHEIVKNFGDYFGKKLSFRNPVSGDEQWMIARINRPKSQNYNTVHKDIYEIYDKYEEIPQMVNVWIPLCGVTEKNSLPIAARSHLLGENEILRTRAGSTMNGLHYSVNSIKSWNNDSSLERVALDNDEILIFSSHLIHGLAYNPEEDITRVSFEFRLFEHV